MLTYRRGDSVDFSTRLKELRERKDLTQKDLANLLKITRQAVSNYEQGTRFPKDEKLLNTIADIFDVSLDYLFGRINIDYKIEYNLNKRVLEHVKEKKEIYDADKIKALRGLLIEVHDLPSETIDKIRQVISILKSSFDK